MTRRERVLAALSHREPDAVPIDFGGTADRTGYDNITFFTDVPGRVPEPGTLALLGLCLAGLGLSRRRRAN